MKDNDFTSIYSRRFMIQNSFLLIALRYLTTKQKDATIRSMIKICFIGICIATCSLTLVVCVMQGFEHATYQKMQSIYPDLIIDAHGEQINTQALQSILQEPQYRIKSSSEQRLGQALLYHQDYGSPAVTFLKGIDPEQEQLVTCLASKITQPIDTTLLSKVIYDNHIFIGSKLASELNLSVHDQATLLYSNDEPSGLKITFQQIPITIGGIFKTGIDDFDNNLAFCTTTLFDQLFPDQEVTQVYIKLHDRCYEQATCNSLKDRLNVDIYSWKSLYPALVSALKLEKWAMFFILLLIVLIASMNMISLIFMYVTQKKKEIALLLCFGMPLQKVTMIFMFMSMSITFCATTVGLILAYCIGLIIQTYPIISLPDDAYITTHLPIQLDTMIFSVIFIASLMLSFIATLISTKKIKTINIAQVLKYE